MENLKFFGQVIKHLLKKYKKETAVITGLFLLVVGIGVTTAFNATKEIKVVVDPNSTASVEETKKIDAVLMDSVQDVLVEKGIDISDDYEISVDLDKKVKDIDTVVVKKKATGTLQVDGKQIEYKSGAETIGDLLADHEIEVDSDDKVMPTADTALTTEVAAVRIARVDVKEEKGQRDIPFETERKENPELAEGTEQVVTEGVAGKEDFVDKVTYEDGAEVARENVSKKTVVEPIKAVVEVGTKKAPAGASGSTGNATQAAGSDFDLICAIVAHEGGISYEGAMGVISCVMNRVDGGWGSSAVEVLTAPGQFSSYLDGYYTQYLGNTPACVQQAVRDCMEGGVRSHSFTSFRSYETPGSVCIAGNWYF